MLHDVVLSIEQRLHIKMYTFCQTMLS